LREEAGRALVRARAEKPFSSLDDLHRRVPELRRDELRKLAAVGALNRIEGVGRRGLGVGSGEVRGQEVAVTGWSYAGTVHNSGVAAEKSGVAAQTSVVEAQNSVVEAQNSVVEARNSV